MTELVLDVGLHTLHLKPTSRDALGLSTSIPVEALCSVEISDKCQELIAIHKQGRLPRGVEFPLALRTNGGTLEVALSTYDAFRAMF